MKFPSSEINLLNILVLLKYTCLSKVTFEPRFKGHSDTARVLKNSTVVLA
jgi:hypothetical protein